jgi:hypothetical protein
VKPLYRTLATIALVVVGPVAAAPPSQVLTGPIAEAVKTALASGTKSFDHGIWNDLLAGAVDDNGRVDYPYVQERRESLDRYLQGVAHVDLSKLRAAELEALLINAYNALTVDSILDHPTAASIRQIDGVWDARVHRVGRFEVTLDEIEHGLLRPFFRDPRIHFAVNCASLSCAPLPRWAFRGADLDRQLDQRARLFLSDARNVRIEGDTLLLSSYFDWYADDFTGEGWKPRADSIPGFIALYAAPEVADRLRANPGLEVEFVEYDWTINASIRPRVGRRRASPQ